MSTTLAIELSNPTADQQAELAAVAFLARYSGRTLESYRYDLRSFFQWAADVGLDVLGATRPHIELFRSSLEERLGPGDHRPAAVDHLRVLPICSHRRPDCFQPCAVRPPPDGAPLRRTRARPLGARAVPLWCRGI